MNIKARLAITAFALAALVSACSAEGGIDTEGDGVSVQGDIDVTSTTRG